MGRMKRREHVLRFGVSQRVVRLKGRVSFCAVSGLFVFVRFFRFGKMKPPAAGRLPDTGGVVRESKTVRPVSGRAAWQLPRKNDRFARCSGRSVKGTGSDRDGRRANTEGRYGKEWIPAGFLFAR